MNNYTWMATLMGIVLLLATGSAPGQQRAQLKAPPSKSEPKVRPTHGQLTARRAKVESNGEIALAEKPRALRKLRSGKTASLIQRSAIIAHRGQWTIVPKESVLYVPAHLRSRVNGERSGRLVTWKEFLVKNRTWLRLEDVRIEQARGEVPLRAEDVKVYEQSGQVVVAVCHNGPISVKPLKEIHLGKAGK